MNKKEISDILNRGKEINKKIINIIIFLLKVNFLLGINLII